ncbi:hypothetical protein [Sphingomonas sp. RS2018]
MPADQLDIDMSSLFDNVDEHQVEFDGEVDGEPYSFAVQYGVFEALTGSAPDDDAVESFNRLIDVVRDAALSALSRDGDQDPVIVSEADLDM